MDVVVDVAEMPRVDDAVMRSSSMLDAIRAGDVAAVVVVRRRNDAVVPWLVVYLWPILIWLVYDLPYRLKSY